MQIMKSKYISAFCGGALFVATVSGAIAQGQQVGVLGLYKADDPQIFRIDQAKVAALGCAIRHTGVIGAAQGSIELEQPNQFVLLACGEALFGDPVKRGQIEGLTGAAQGIAVLEGDLTDFPMAKRDSAVSGRQYILKIGYYNNRDVDARDQDLAALSQQAEALPDAYATEAFIGVTHASGLARPDEVVVLFYDSADAGERFRKNNKALLGTIGAFNKAHLSQSVYYVGQVTQ
ncbi:MAG: hypothetical protein KUG69_14005 [Marinosulfonomonas sp.]|nr:hypothetical protein [Marinosulfonomonas sp.]